MGTVTFPHCGARLALPCGKVTVPCQRPNPDNMSGGGQSPAQAAAASACISPNILPSLSFT